MSEYLLPDTSWPSSLSEPHRQLLRSAIATLQADPRVLGLAAGGSFRTNVMDAFSDLDLVVVVRPDAWPAILDEREALVRRIGPILAAFTGEHVGERRLLITLFGLPLLHVDFKFLVPDMLVDRVEDPVVLWERGGALSTAMSGSIARYPQPDLQWIEDRFWVWIHYLVAKVGRGELFEAVDGLGFLRYKVFGPLLLQEAGETPNGVRRLERVSAEQVERVKQTIATYDAAHVLASTMAAVELYRELRAASPVPIVCREQAEAAAMDYATAIIDSRRATSDQAEPS